MEADKENVLRDIVFVKLCSFEREMLTLNVEIDSILDLIKIFASKYALTEDQ